MPDIEKILGDAVKAARLEQGLTLDQVAEMTGVDVRTVMNIENYKDNPKQTRRKYIYKAKNNKPFPSVLYGKRIIYNDSQE